MEKGVWYNWLVPSACPSTLYFLWTVSWAHSVMFGCSANFIELLCSHVLHLTHLSWVFRWSEAHHQTEALGPFWSVGGKIRVVPRWGSCLHRLLTPYAGADPRETSYSSRVSQAPPGLTPRSFQAMPQRYTLVYSIAYTPSCPFPDPFFSLFTFSVEFFLQGFQDFR